jgi:hypothetical protein
MPTKAHTTEPAQTRAPRSRNSGTLTAADVLAVQRSAGNRAAQQLIAQRRVQAKLTVGPVDDRFEREADRMADAVLSSPLSTADASPLPVGEAERPGGRSGVRQLQRETTPEEDELQTQPLAAQITPMAQREAMPGEDEEVQRQVEEEDEVQTKAVQRNGDGSFDAGADVEQRIARSKGAGSPLPDATRAEMESKFGADFSGVRVHAGDEAAQLNGDLSAHAFTHGSDVYFGAGKFAPAGSEGEHLLAHELTHVVQQSQTVKRKEKKRSPTTVIAKGAEAARIALILLQNPTVVSGQDAFGTVYKFMPGQRIPGDPFSLVVGSGLGTVVYLRGDDLHEAPAQTLTHNILPGAIAEGGAQAMWLVPISQAVIEFAMVFVGESWVELGVSAIKFVVLCKTHGSDIVNAKNACISFANLWRSLAQDCPTASRLILKQLPSTLLSELMSSTSGFLAKMLRAILEASHFSFTTAFRAFLSALRELPTAFLISSGKGVAHLGKDGMSIVRLALQKQIGPISENEIKAIKWELQNKGLLQKLEKLLEEAERLDHSLETLEAFIKASTEANHLSQ